MICSIRIVQDDDDDALERIIVDLVLIFFALSLGPFIKDVRKNT